MRYKYFVPTAVRQQIAKDNFGKNTLEKLQSYEQSDAELLRCSILVDNALISRENTHGAPRFIWFKEVKGDVCLYVLRRLYKHDVYRTKISEGTKNYWVKRHAFSDDEQKEIDGVFAQMLVEEKREPLPEEYQTYEERPRRFEEKNDVIVYELPEWVSGYADVSDLHKESIHDHLNHLFVENDVEWPQNDENGFFFTKVKDYNIVFRTETNVNGGDIKSIYLIQIGKEINLEILKEHHYNCENVTALQRKSSKCYPQFLLLDFDSWHAIEEDDQANLALSSEELEILQDIEYPFFVSGLAGSGKSTILYYLFAHVFDYIIKHNPDHKLLFLSYSNKLVKNAQDIVHSILANHPAYNLGDRLNDPDVKRDFERSFQPFKDFLKAEFLNREESAVFADDKRIDYQDFKVKYESCQLPEKRNYSPDIVWSVIRTFIKGKDGNSYFTPEEYDSTAMASKDVTVTMKQYKEIYKIWDSWYRKYYDEKEGWDDLDLVRYVLQKHDLNKHFHKFAVVFCDEAQDFTKVETDLILKLSAYSKYDLSLSDEDQKIPIAFAGDPNQTVNPTGFRWGSTQAIFTNSFKKAIGKFVGFEENELHTNYRSREGIVKFANTIQYLRHHFLSQGRQALSLQKAWDSEESAGKGNSEVLSYVAFFSLDKYRQEIEKGLQQAYVITADDGEYAISNSVVNDSASDKLFKETEKRKEALGIPQEFDNSRLYTAITSKGLEFKANILYNFSSDDAMFLFEKLLQGGKLENDSEEYRLSHFFTKLYIAISRAKQVLYIVDTDKAYNHFWKYFVEKDLWQQFLGTYLTDKSISSSLGRISQGNIEDFANRLAENYRPKEYAESLFKIAIGDSDKETMNRARSAFKEAKCEDKATLCEAYMFKFDRQYKEAGHRFEALEKYDEAIGSYWAGQCWTELLAAIQNPVINDETLDVKRIVAQYMLQRMSVAEFLEKWKNQEDLFQNSISDSHNRDLWCHVLDRVSGECAKLKQHEITDTLLKNLDHHSSLFEWYNDSMVQLRATMHYKRASFINRSSKKGDADFKQEDYTQATKLWEQSGSTNEKEYFTAKKLLSVNDSEEIKWMARLGENEEIVKRFGDESYCTKLNEEAQSYIFTSLLNLDYTKAIVYPYPKGQQEKWNRLYQKDRFKFLLHVMLMDFTEEKYYFFVDKMKLEENTVFDEALPSGVFELIFKLTGTDVNGKPYWTYFTTEMKDANGKLVLKNEINRKKILDALSNVIINTKAENKDLASCLLEYLFDKDYDYTRSKNYAQALTVIFGQDIFFKEDFRNFSHRNKYFTEIRHIEDDELDHLKDHVRKHVATYLEKMRKVSHNDMTEVKAMFRAFEICAAYQGNTPDMRSICNFYSKNRNDKRLSIMRDWVEQRYLFNHFLLDGQSSVASFDKFVADFKYKNLGFKSLVDDFTKEDAVMFVAAINSNDSAYSFEGTLLSAKLIYKYRMRRDTLRPFCIVKDLIANMSNFIDLAIDEVLSDREKYSDYSVKVLSYVWESLYEYHFTAIHYNNLISKKKIASRRILSEYLKKRALLQYFHIGNKLFIEKQEEYEVHMTKDYLPAAYPKIEERVAKKDDASKEEKKEKPQKETKKSPTKKTSKPKGKAVDVAKAAILEVARKMLLNGMTVETVKQCTNLEESEIIALQKE